MNKVFIGVAWLAVAGLIVLMGVQIVHSSGWSPQTWGLLMLLLAYAFSVGATGNLNPFAMGLGDDGKLSLSKSQTLFWTYVVLYAFAAIYAHDAQLCTAAAAQDKACGPAATTPTPAPAASPAPGASAAPGVSAAPGTSAAQGTSGGGAPELGANALVAIAFPNSVLLLLGFSVTSLVAAAGITRSQIATGQIQKHTRKPGEKPDLSPRWLIVDDQGQVDLTRFQVVLWTIAAAGAFISDAQFYLSQKQLFIASLPDVGSALVLLMGIGQAAYVGGKLVVTPNARIIRVGPAHAAAGATATVTGSGFGASKAAGSDLLMDGAPVPAANITSWSDGAIVFTVPDPQPGGAAWPPAPASTTVQLTVANGAAETNAVPFTVP